MVAEVVVAFIHAFDALHVVAGDVQRDETRAVRGQCHVDDVEIDALHGHFVVAWDLTRRREAHLGLRFVRPGLVRGETLLQLTHAGEPRIQLVAITGSQLTLERFCLRTYHIHHAATTADQFRLPLLLGGRVIDKKSREELHRTVFRRNHRAVLRVARARLRVRIQNERRKPRLMPQVLRHELIQRDRVPRRRATRIRTRRKDAPLRRVTSRDPGMR